MKSAEQAGNEGFAGMCEVVNNLRELNMYSLIIRLFLAMLFGGLIGLERGWKRRAAGFRTYMLVCMGAALTMLLGQYEYVMMRGQWKEAAELLGMKADVARIAAQVINGIGFLGAGTVIVTNIQEIKGLTTAAGLWASACMGIAIGSGFYEVVICGFLLILFTTKLLSYPENLLMERARNMNIYVELESLASMDRVLKCLRENNIVIYDVEIHKEGDGRSQNPNAIFSLKIGNGMLHTEVITMISELDKVCGINEI